MKQNYTLDKAVQTMNVLGNPLRIDILKLIHKAPQSFTALMNHLSVDSTSKLIFHLSKMDPLVVKRESDGLYELTDLGLITCKRIYTFEAETAFIYETEGEKDNKQETTNETINPATWILFIGAVFPLVLMILLIPFYLFEWSFLMISFLFPIIGLILYFILAFKLEIDYNDTIFGGFVFLFVFLCVKIPFIVGFPTIAIISSSFILDYNDPILLDIIMRNNSNLLSIALITIYIGILLGLIVLLPTILDYFDLKWPESNNLSLIVHEKSICNSKTIKFLSFLIIICSIIYTLLPEFIITCYLTNLSEGYSPSYDISISPVLASHLPIFLPAIIIFFVNENLKEKEYIHRNLRVLIICLIILATSNVMYEFNSLWGFFFFDNRDLTKTFPGQEFEVILFVFVELSKMIMKVGGIIVLWHLIAELYRRGSYYNQKRLT